MKVSQFLNFAQKPSFSSFRLLLVLLVCAVAFTSCKDDEDEGTTPEKNITQIVIDDPNFSSLEAALIQADLVSVFQGNTEYTVFAPTNAAFDALLSALGVTLADVSKEQLTAILTYHVVAGEAKSSSLSNGQSLTTLNTGTLAVSINGGTVKINNATVTQADVDASNGVIHVIDQVLVP